MAVTSELRSSLKNVWGSRMLHHSEPQDGVVKTEYSNGCIVYINYNDSSVAIDGQILEAKNYKVVEA